MMANKSDELDSLRWAAATSRESAMTAINSAFTESDGFARSNYLKAAAQKLRDEKVFAGAANMLELFGADEG